MYLLKESVGKGYSQRVNRYYGRYSGICRKPRGIINRAGIEKETVSEKLRKLQEVDIRTVNPDELVDIADVRIRKDLPTDERLKDFIRQIKNPYCYRSNGVTVKISFSGKRTLEDCLMSCISMEGVTEPAEDEFLMGSAV